jgi:hypothetical protein
MKPMSAMHKEQRCGSSTRIIRKDVVEANIKNACNNSDEYAKKGRVGSEDGGDEPSFVLCVTPCSEGLC